MLLLCQPKAAELRRAQRENAPESLHAACLSTCSLTSRSSRPQVTQVTPGNNVDEILKVVTSLAPSFEQTVLLGYPPFVKGVVDKGLGQGVAWGSYKLGFVFAGEVFSEVSKSCNQTDSPGPCCEGGLSAGPSCVSKESWTRGWARVWLGDVASWASCLRARCSLR